MPANISKVLIVIASPIYQQDQRSNTINLLCREFLEAMQDRDVEMNLIDLYQEKFENLVHLPEADNPKTVLDFQEKIQDSDLIVFFHPIWWGDLPAILKGFIESVLHKGFAYKYHRKFLKPLLTGKQMMVITTGTKADWIYRFLDRNRLYLFWKRLVSEQTGIKLTKFLRFTKIRTVSDKTIQGWKKRIRKIASKIGQPKSQE